MVDIKRHIAMPDWRLLAVGLLMLCANLPVVVRYTHELGGLAYALACSALVAMVCWEWPSPDLWRRAVWIVVPLMFAVQIVLLIYVAPAYDARMDRDDALTLWWQRLLQGIYPYASPTSIGNPISVLPFLHLLALPFVLAGNVGLLVIAGVAALAALLWRRYAGNPSAQILALLFVTTAPVVLFEVAGRSEILVNMLLFVALVLWVEAYVEGKARAKLLWLGAFCGAVAATRFALWPAMVVPVVYLLRHLSWRQAVLVLLAALVAFTLLVGPFVVWRPDVFFGYAPFGVNATKLGDRSANQAIWLTLTALVVTAATLYALRTGRLVLASVPILMCSTLATWMTFGYDVSYAQLLFMPLLFVLPTRGAYARQTI